ncbi:MAG: hypothetical protein ACLFVJ_04660 [Persicimonas sp.]
MNIFSRCGRVCLFFVAGMLVVGVAACSGQQEVPDSSPMPQGQSFSGVWYSSQFEHMHLRQSGDKVEGIYTYKNGGRIEGEVDGNILVFEWVEPGDKAKAQRTMKGKGYLALTVEADEAKLQGEWGYKENRTGGGPWKAEYIRELEPDDPLTLEALEESRD